MIRNSWLLESIFTLQVADFSWSLHHRGPAHSTPLKRHINNSGPRKCFSIWSQKTYMCTWHAGHGEHLNPGPSTALSWCIKSWILSNALTCPYCPRWSCCTGTWAKTRCVTSDWSKAHRFLTNVTNQISIKYSRLLDFLIKRCDLAPLASPSPLSNMFSMRRGQAECKLREKHYTCLSEQAGGTSHRQVKKERNGSQEGQSQDL